MRIFKCANGFSYQCPDNSCLFCDHCTDIFYDYTNGPYMIICDLNKEPHENCESFTEGEGNNG